MIKFERVRFKNFIKTGNAFNEIELCANPTTLVLGKNGVGKSQILDAICFALYGRGYKNITKPQLVNSINKRDCVVEIEFKVGRRNYKVIRGIKPAIFEIWVNGKLLDQDAATRDSQAFLEESVLKMNYRSFTQIVILGAAAFVPFMKLPAASRRELVEELLDIRIFGQMNSILKERIGVSKDAMAAIDTELTLAKERALMKHEYIKTLQGDRQKRLDEIDAQINTCNAQIAEAEEKLTNLNKNLGVIEEEEGKILAAEIQINAYRREIGDLVRAREALEQTIRFYESNDNCPTCKQNIDDAFKADTQFEQRQKVSRINDQIVGINGQIGALSLVLDRKNELLSQKDMWEGLENDYVTNIRGDQNYIKKLEAERSVLQAAAPNITAEKAALKTLAQEVVNITKRSYLNIAAELLKDTGIKTTIVRQYLPAINKLVNKYLDAMDLFVSFELDETFTEHIRSRHRDDYSYESFSEGEKKRIDLALTFTWRAIAKMRNNASTNLLILDEVFDSALDAEGTEYVLTLLDMLSGDQTNIWVISPKGDHLCDKFNNVIRFADHQNFSVMV
jgi:DNA repair exonuclease SbcCD ATPase subunit